MATNKVKIMVLPETKEYLNNCVSEFRIHHPEFHHLHLSQDKIIRIISQYYCENRFTEEFCLKK